jgi:ribosome-associated translation inhibitor RaiA
MNESQRVRGVVGQLMEKFDKYAIPGAKAIVVVDETHHKESKGVFQVKVRLSVPGERIYVARGREKTGMHDGVYSAMAGCFDSIERQLVKWHTRRASHRALRAYEDAA